MMLTVYSLLSIGINLYICGYTFKNYSNSFVSALLLNVLVSCALDLFVIRTLGFAIFSVGLSINSRLISYIDDEKLRENYVEDLSVHNMQADCVSNSSKKESTSPSKARSYNKENQESLAIRNALEIAKKIKKEKLGQEGLLRSLSNRNEVGNKYPMREQETLNQLVDEEDAGKMQRISPIHNINDDDN